MKKRAISLFLVVSMSFTLFYPNLSLNDNVLEIVSGEEVYFDGNDISLTELLRMPKGERKYRLKLLKWFNELCR